MKNFTVCKDAKDLSKKSVSCEIPKEINTVKDSTQYLTFGHLWSL